MSILSRRYGGVVGEGRARIETRIENDVRGLLGELRARGLVLGDDVAPGPKEPRSIRKPEVLSVSPKLEPKPYTLVAELTTAARWLPLLLEPSELVRAQNELTTEEWLRVVDEAAALGVMQMHLSGGEPLVRRDLEAIAAPGARGTST